MTNAEQENEDNVLRRMLATKPTPHKPKVDSERAKPKTRAPSGAAS